MAKRRRSSTHRVPPARSTFQFKISLKYIRPAIWRRMVVPDNRTLGDLHWIIQLSMGRTNSHLHLFRIGLLEYGAAGDDEEVGFSAVDENSALLSCLGLGKGSKFIYEYDFGDSWTHEIVVEKIEPATQVRPPGSGKGEFPVSQRI